MRLVEAYAELLEASEVISIVKPLVGYHGTWQDIKELVPREVQGLDTVGTWVSLSPTAAKMYSGQTGRVLRVTVPKGRYYRAWTDDFTKFFINIPLVEKHFSKRDADIIKKGFYANDWAWNARWKNTFGEALWKGPKGSAYMKDWRDLLIKQGYKGVMWVRSRIDLQPSDKSHTVVLMFDHKPLKTAMHWKGNEGAE